jgi:hypothetical protein
MNESRILRISKRLRNIHRRGKFSISLKQFARLSAATVTSEERRADPVALARKDALTIAPLAWHWLNGRGMATA